MGEGVKRCLVVGLVALFSSGSLRADIVSGLNGHWPLDERSGATARNLVAATHDGSLLPAGASFAKGYAPGAAGTSFRFDGTASTTGEYVRAGNFKLGATSSSRFTIAFWLRSDPTLGASSPGVTFLTWESGTYPQVSYPGAGQALLLSYKVGAAVQTLPIPSLTRVPARTWYHLAFTYDQANLIAYLDGRVAAQRAGVLNLDTTGTTLQFGFIRPTGDTKPIDGSLDDVRVYNRALSAEDIGELAAEPDVGRMLNDGIDYLLSPPNEAVAEDARSFHWLFTGGGDGPPTMEVPHWHVGLTSLCAQAFAEALAFGYVAPASRSRAREVLVKATRYLVDHYRDPVFATMDWRAARAWPFFSLCHFVRLKTLGFLEDRSLLDDDLRNGVREQTQALIRRIRDCFAVCDAHGFPEASYELSQSMLAGMAECLGGMEAWTTETLKRDGQCSPCQDCNRQPEYVPQVTFKTAPALFALLEAHDAGEIVIPDADAASSLEHGLRALFHARMPGPIDHPDNFLKVAGQTTYTFEDAVLNKDKKPHRGAFTYLDRNAASSCYGHVWNGASRTNWTSVPGSIQRTMLSEALLYEWNGARSDDGEDRVSIPYLKDAAAVKKALDAYFRGRANYIVPDLNDVVAVRALQDIHFQKQFQATQHETKSYGIAGYFVPYGVWAAALTLRRAERIASRDPTLSDEARRTCLDDLREYRRSLTQWIASSERLPGMWTYTGVSSTMTAFMLLSLLAVQEVPPGEVSGASAWFARLPLQDEYMARLGVYPDGSLIPVEAGEQILFAQRGYTRSIYRDLCPGAGPVPTYQNVHDLARDRIFEFLSGLDRDPIDSDDGWIVVKQAVTYADPDGRPGGFGCSQELCQAATNTTYHNVIAVQRGFDPSLRDDVIAVGAHYDSYCQAPGADDNGAGVAAVLELARTLSPYPSRRTIAYVLFDLEEVDFGGSTAFVDEFPELFPGCSLYEALVFDEIAHKNDLPVQIGTRNAPGMGSRLAAAMSAFAGSQRYGITSQLLNSDNATFDAAGVPAVLLYQGPDRVFDTEIEHKTADALDSEHPAAIIDHAKAMAVVRASAGFLADEAGLCFSGDLDRDGDIDWGDYALFESCCRTSPACYAQAAPGGAPCYQVAADIDRDGDVDADDWTAFFALWSGTPELRPFEPCLSSSADCDLDGIPDRCQILYGFSADTDGDGVPDACEGKRFKRGDSNVDGRIDIGDGINILNYLFQSKKISCLDTADANDSGLIDIADAIFLLNYTIGGCSMIPPPYPACGIDPTADSLSCAAYNEDVNCAR